MSESIINTNYLNWLFTFLLKYDSLSTDTLSVYELETENDMKNIQNISEFIFGLEKLSIIYNVRAYTYYFSKTNTSEKRIYFSYNNKHFVMQKVIGKDSHILIRKVKRKDKHKYLNLDKFVT
ncbi:MAG: hypothetical protein IJ809_05270 [Clostridia bacterium]|nr:hypothetical protein [Clostridia bacterium]